MVQQHAVKIKAYHEDNGISHAHAWVKSYTKQAQAFIFAGTNAHYDNVIEELRIRNIQDITRTQFIHAAKRWQ